MYSDRCTICRHPQCSDIDFDLATGATLSDVSDSFGVSRSALHRHRSGGHSVRALEEQEAAPVFNSEAYLSGCRKFMTDAEKTQRAQILDPLLARVPTREDVRAIFDALDKHGNVFVGNGRYRNVIPRILKDLDRIEGAERQWPALLCSIRDNVPYPVSTKVQIALHEAGYTWIATLLAGATGNTATQLEAHPILQEFIPPELIGEPDVFEPVNDPTGRRLLEEARQRHIEGHRNYIARKGIYCVCSDCKQLRNELATAN